MLNYFAPSLRFLSLFMLLAVLVITGCGPVTDVPGTPTPAGMPLPNQGTRFALVPGETQASFAIGEILLGEPKTVTAVSNGVSGELVVDFDEPANTAVGPITVETNQFVTDNDFRNQAIQRRILISAAYPVVTFTPDSISGLPAQIVLGEETTFQISGDLMITGNSRPVTFDVRVRPVSATRLEGEAAAVIERSDFGLVVPSATSVAGVEEEVQLTLKFAATAQE